MKDRIICWLLGHPLKFIYWESSKNLKVWDSCKCRKRKVFRGTGHKYFMKP